MIPSTSFKNQEDRSSQTQRIRPELNIEKWSIWQPANSRGQGLKERVFEREVHLPDGTKVRGTLTVSPTAKGDLTNEDQRVYYALVKLWEAKGRSDTYTSFSLRQLSKVLQRRWGSQTIKSLRGSLARLAMTSLTWDKTYEDGAARSRLGVNEVFHIVGTLKTVYREKDGHVTTEAGYFRFHDAILKNLHAHYTKPVLFDVVLSFRSGIAQILYTHLDLILSDKTSYERRSKELFEDLGLAAKEYSKPSARARRLEPALKELLGKPITTGSIAKATLKRTKDGEDFKLVVTKGRAAAALPAEPEVIPFATRRRGSPEAEELVRYFHQVFHHTRDCSPTWKALEQATGRSLPESAKRRPGTLSTMPIGRPRRPSSRLLPLVAFSNTKAEPSGILRSPRSIADVFWGRSKRRTKSKPGVSESRSSTQRLPPTWTLSLMRPNQSSIPMPSRG